MHFVCLIPDHCCRCLLLWCIQLATLRAERDSLAQQNTTLANTTQQLMMQASGPDQPSEQQQQQQPGSAPGGWPLGGSDDSPRMGWGSSDVPPWAGGSSSGQQSMGQPSMAVPSQPRPRAATEPGGFSSEVPRAAASQVQRPRITSAQLREIGTMLQRLTRENAALIQARDAAQAALEPLTEELRAARATLAAAEAGAGAAARQAAAQEAAAAEAGQELARLRIGQRKATTDKERLTAEVRGA